MANSKRPQRGRPAQARRKKTPKVSNLNPADLQQKAQAPTQTTFRAKAAYAEWPLHPKLKKALAQKGFDRPTEIQERCWPALAKGGDLLGIARTGTGKTGAFLIPLLHRLLSGEKHLKTLVLAPTRELAVQIEEEFRSLSKGLGFYSVVYIGGTNINKDLQRAQHPHQLVVATPGRLLDLVDRRAVHLGQFHNLILDEFDRMLDMGFAREVRRITEAMQGRKQTMLFSATLDKTQQPFIDKLLHQATEVKVSNGEVTGAHIDQETIRVPEGGNKFHLLLDMLQQPEFEKVLVFAETKRGVSKVRKKLQQAGVRSDEIHGNKTQNYRQKALKQFASGKVRVLVATDVAARGLDIDDVSHVINFQMPMTMDSYIHRIGRTGRAGKTGKAYTFVN